MALSVLASPAHYRLDPAFGSEYQWTVEILSRVAQQGASVTAITGTFDDAAFANGLLGPIDVHGVWKENPTLSHARRIDFAVRTWREAARHLKRKHYDVLHHVLPFAFHRTFNLLALSEAKNLPFVLGPVQPSLQSDTSDELNVASRNFDATRKTGIADAALEFAQFVPRKLSGRTVRRADVVIAVSDEARRICHEINPSARVIVASPGVDTSRYVPPDDLAANSEILVSGFLTRRKQVDLVIKALAQVDPSLFSVLRIVGDGPERVALQQLAHDLGVADRVVFQGLVPNSEMAEFYRKAAVVCFVSKEETVGMAAMETMACGIPLIATATGIVPQLLTDATVGTIVDGDHQAIAAALSRVLGSPDVRRRQGAAARALLQREYQWDHIAKKYSDAYEEAIEIRGRSSARVSAS